MVPISLAPAHRAEARGTATLVALFDLTKPRLAAMSVLSAMVAYATAGGSLGATHALATLLGTTAAAGGALSLNQWWERSADALMARTRGRPLPQSRLSPALALRCSLALSGGGVALLAGGVDATAALLAAVTIALYGAIYTPLKRRSRWATEVGAISGALPALLGNAAAGDVFARPGVVLAAVLLVWQMPHFFAIGWKYRADYRAAGFPLLPAIDPTGRRTAAWSFGYTIVLLCVSVAPWVMGWAGAIYGLSALGAGVTLAWESWKFLRAAETRDRAARTLFAATLLHLPIVMGGLVLERVFLA